MNKNISIAVSGKGGVGKSTIAALLIKALVKRGDGTVFAIDADPNSCLADYLGLEIESTVGSIREETIKSIADIPPGMTKDRWLSYRIQEVIVESKGMDLITMGRQEGPGCYCYINNLLREFQDSVQKRYSYIVIDNEAGMEHLSRRTKQPVDYLLIVSDLSISGIKAAARIRELSDQMNLARNKRYLVLNKTIESLPQEFSNSVEKLGLKIAGMVPEDKILQSVMLKEESIMDFNGESPAFEAVRGLIEELGF